MPEGTTYYEYNPENLLTRIVLPDGSENTFDHDADSQRVLADDCGARRGTFVAAFLEWSLRGSKF